MRIIYMGTPAFSLPALDALHQAGHEIVAVYTQPPRAANRGKALTPSPVHQHAKTLGLNVHTPLTLKDAAEQTIFAEHRADITVVAAYGLILPPAILQAPRYGCVNIHASLLPRWRGAAPIQRAILAGDEVTGVTIMQMERGLDTGPMLAALRTPIEGKTAGELTQELAKLGAKLMVDTLARFETIVPVPQPAEGVTYAAKIEKSEAHLDFSQPAVQVERAVRAFNPAPGAFTTLMGERLKILAAEISDASGPPGTVIDERLTIACGTGALRPTLVQRAGKAAMPTEALLRGLMMPPGTVAQ